MANYGNSGTLEFWNLNFTYGWAGDWLVHWGFGQHYQTLNFRNIDQASQDWSQAHYISGSKRQIAIRKKGVDKVRNRIETSPPRGGTAETGMSWDVWLYLMAGDGSLSWSVRENGRWVLWGRQESIWWFRWISMDSNLFPCNVFLSITPYICLFMDFFLH